MCEVSSIDQPDWTTMSTVLAPVQRDSQVTLKLSEDSDNQWFHTKTSMEDSLSLSRAAYCIDFVILVIGLYFYAAGHCYIFLPLFLEVLFKSFLIPLVKCKMPR